MKGKFIENSLMLNFAHGKCDCPEQLISHTPIAMNSTKLKWYGD